MRGAFRGVQARPGLAVGQRVNPESVGATRGTGARTGSVPCIAAGHSRDLDLKARAAGSNIAQFA
jgi:hypothetical protein